jgi:hypothetical protein
MRSVRLRLNTLRIQLENSLLRRLVTDLLLGKIKLEETAKLPRVRRSVA